MQNYIKAIYIVSILTASGVSQGQELEQSRNQLRIDFSWNSSATGLDDGFDEIIVSETSLDGILTFQSSIGIYGQLGQRRASINEIELNGRAVDVNEKYESDMFGFGYRFSREGAQERFWGVGYQNSKSTDDGAEALDTLLAFWEKDNKRRYGVIDLAYSSATDFSVISVSGRHVWFDNSALGFGVTWGLGSGQYDTPPGFTDIDVGMANIGLLIMFRPKF